MVHPPSSKMMMRKYVVRMMAGSSAPAGIDPAVKVSSNPLRQAALDQWMVAFRSLRELIFFSCFSSCHKFAAGAKKFFPLQLSLDSL